MKKLTLLVFTLLLSGVFYAQEEPVEEKQEKNFNKFSIEANVGINRLDDTFSPGYFSSDPNTEFAVNSIGHFDLGLRYMFSEKFGLKLDGAYDTFEPESDSSIPFETNQIRFGLQGVVNLRNILKFNTFSSRLGLLGHAGVQYSMINPDSRNGVDISDNTTDRNGGFIFGFTPQFRIANRLVLTADASFIQNYRSHITWDGAKVNDKNLNSSMMNFSLGLTLYLGKHDVHADWYYEDKSAEIASLRNELKNLEEEVKKLPETLKPDDNNKNGFPDIYEEYVNNNFATKNYVDNSVQNVNIIESLMNEDYVNIFFGFDSVIPEVASIGDINTIIVYLKNNPDEEIKLTGYTDIIGNDTYNKKLSEQRAKYVNDILVAAGIDQSRIEYTGSGVNPNYKDKEEYNRIFARRVMVELK